MGDERYFESKEMTFWTDSITSYYLVIDLDTNEGTKSKLTMPPG